MLSRGVPLIMNMPGQWPLETMMIGSKDCMQCQWNVFLILQRNNL